MKSGADTLCNGLRFVESRDGLGGSWVRRYKSRTGKMKQYTFAKYPELSVIEARAYVELVRGQENTVACQFGEPTIGVLIDRYLDEYIKAQRSSGSAATVRSAMVRNLRPVATKKLDQVSAAMLHELILTVKKRAPTMANLLRSELKQAWSYGLSIGLTSVVCPITSMTGGRFKASARDRVLSDTELPLIINSLGNYSRALADVIIICLYTGLRSGEVVGISSFDFEIDNGVLWLTIPRERMKNKLAHRVPIFSRAREVIERRIEEKIGSFLFPTKRDSYKQIKQVTLAREVYRTLSAVRDWHLHDLRRTTRTNLQRIGCPFEISETILAHKLPGVSSVYARFQYTDEKVKWLKELADYYDRLTSSPT